MRLSVTEIARVCHEANRAYCEALGDESQVAWSAASEQIRQSAMSGVVQAMEHPEWGPWDMHAAWKRWKEERGWIFADVKDDGRKTHPCLVDWPELPPEQKAKDRLFLGIVRALAGREE